MKRQLSNTIYSLKFAMEKNDFERLKSSSGKKRNDFVDIPIYGHPVSMLNRQVKWGLYHILLPSLAPIYIQSL